MAKDLSVVSTHWSFHVTLQWSIFLGEASEYEQKQCQMKGVLTMGHGSFAG